MYQNVSINKADNMNSAMFAFVLIACPIIAVTGYGHQDEDNGPAHYKFDYSVHDPHTGDVKEQYEERDGHVVKGAYSFHEADGTKRIVEYIADPHTGFNAVVKRVGHAHHPQHYHHHGGASSGGHNHGSAHSTVGVTHFGYHH